MPDDVTGVITLDSLLNNPEFDFLKQYTHSDQDNDDDNNPSPYESLAFNCKYFDDLSFANACSRSKNKIILSLNIQSLPAKFSELEEFINILALKECFPDFICLQEIWQIHDSAILELKNYNFVFSTRKNNVQGGGVGIYVRKGIQFKVLKDISTFMDKVIETLFIEVTENKQKYIIGSVYRPNSKHKNLSSNEQMDQFLELFSLQLAHFSTLKVPLYVLGDFNIDILKYSNINNFVAKRYIDMLTSYGLLQLITKPTRCTSNSVTLLDHILTNSFKNEITYNWHFDFKNF